ncbi:MAG TPA: hypothetical protein VFB65_15565 [Pyrinomonadaceae bacterium]|nr:hypothetical protein [Pyrinomonadaceae bacterium]
MTKKTWQAGVISAVVEKLRIIQTFGLLILLLTIRLDRRCRRCSVLQSVTHTRDDHGADQDKL